MIATMQVAIAEEDASDGVFPPFVEPVDASMDRGDPAADQQAAPLSRIWRCAPRG
jgi:hypothetical protein